jgi:hypothetical protein
VCISKQFSWKMKNAEPPSDKAAGMRRRNPKVKPTGNSSELNSGVKYVHFISRRNDEEVKEALDGASDSTLKAGFYSVFCPRSFYKGKLAQGYARFQSFDTLQALCSYLRGVLCTQALLKGLGVGSSEASAGAAALTFITKDGAGMLGSLGLAWGCSESFGRRVKAWRLFADITNDVALAIDLYAPRFAPSNTFVTLVCVSSVLKAWCGVSAGATRAAITAHFAVNAEDIADVAAKEGSQETAVTLLGMTLGYLFLKYASDSSDVQTNFIWGLFWILTGIHVWANYQAVRSLHFRTIDWTRLDIILMLKKTSFREVSNVEPVIPRKPIIGYPEFGISETATERSDFLSRNECKHVAICGKRIVVDRAATGREVICAAFAVRWAQLCISRSIPASELSIMAVNAMESYLELVDELESIGWDLESSRALLGDIDDNRQEFAS